MHPRSRLPRADFALHLVPAVLLGLVVALIHARPASAGNLAWTGNGPRAKSIKAVVRDPLNPSRMWAASFGAGVLRSLDGGATWTAYRTGLVNTYVRCLAVQPRHPDSVYCGTNDGAYLSTDGGAHWGLTLSTTDTTSHSVRAIAIDPTRSGTVYAGTYGLGIYKSVNAGASWTAINLGLANSFIRAIAIHPACPETVLAGAGTGGGIQRSYNGGLQWNVHPVLDTTATTGAAVEIQFDPADPSRIYAAMLEKGVLRSRNGGNSWVRINGGLPSLNSRSLQVVSSERYVGTAESGVFHATMPNDSTWVAVNTGLVNPTVEALLSSNAAPGTVWAGTDGGGIYRTDTFGASWSPLDGGLLDTYGFSLAVRPSGHVLYVGTGFGDQTWRSVDQAGSWTRCSYLFTHDSEHGIAPDPVAASTVYLTAYGAGVYRSTDDGATWYDPDSLNLTLGNRFVRSLIAWPGQGGHLLVGTGNGVWASTDGGSHWAPKGSGLPSGFSTRSLALAPGSPATIYAGDVSGVYKLVDDGASPWTAKSKGLKSSFVHDLLVDGFAATTVYAATDSGLFRSVDAAENWVAINAGLPAGSPRALAQDPVHGGALFCGISGAGVYESLDGGASWAVLGNPANLPSTVVRSLAVDAALGIVYAGTDAGVSAYATYPNGRLSVEDPAGAALRLVASPNPARALPVRIRYGLPRAGRVAIEVFGLRGERVRTIVEGEQTAGDHSVMWEARGPSDRPLSPGLYFVRLTTPDAARVSRIVLLER